jgi:nucleoid-associated protein YgaU
MGNFEKLGILVIIVLVVVILVLAVWGMGVPSDYQDGGVILTGNELRAGTGNGIDGKEDPERVLIPDHKDDGRGRDRWPEPRDDVAREPEPKLETDRKNDPKTEPDPVASDLTHKVVEGDKLWPLADRYYGNGKYWTVIRDANPGIDPGALPVGKTLQIPHPDKVLAKRGSSSSTNSSVAKSTTGNSTGGNKTYTVRKNDTLSTIAARTLGSSTLWKKLYEANRKAIGSDPDDLRLGMILVIP